MVGQNSKPVDNLGSKNDLVLSEVIKRYVAAKQAEWTAKSSIEFKSVFRLLQGLMLDRVKSTSVYLSIMNGNLKSF